MIKIENIHVDNIVRAIYSARNAMNSWDKSDSDLDKNLLGANDLKLAKRLSKAGSDHAKFLRMITVTCDIIAPRLFYLQLDTYKVGTVSNSCSTMHRIMSKPFELSDFSYEKLGYDGMSHLEKTIELLNFYRDKYIKGEDWNYLTKQDFWYEVIYSLPQSYNQKRTWQANYQVLKNIYHARKNHKLDEWHDFCDWIKTLPLAEELICLKGDE